MKTDNKGFGGLSPLQQLDGIDTFSDVVIQKETLEEILEDVKGAPSLANSQPWEFIVTESCSVKEKMAHALLDVQFRQQEPCEQELSWFATAPVIITIALNRLRAKAKVGDDGADRFGMVDLGGALIYLVQSMATKGLGGTIVREFDRCMGSEILSLPTHIDPVIQVVLGYRLSQAKVRPHLRIDEYVHWDTWTTHIRKEE